MDGKLRNMTSVYITKAGKMLLLFRRGSRVVKEVWTGSAGGHFEECDLNDARACILREMEEELGLNENDVENLSLRYITLRRTKGEIRQNYYFFAQLSSEADEHPVSNEGITRWFAYPELLDLEMPYTAKFVIEHYLKVGHAKDEIYGGVADGETVVFTRLPEF